jgi:hypothetical protein
MELSTLATSAVAILVRQLKEDRGTDPVLNAAADRVRSILIDRLRTIPAAHEAITALTQTPDDQVRQADVHLAIRAAAETDEAFCAKLTEAVRVVRRIEDGEETEEPAPSTAGRLSSVTVFLLILATAGLAAAAASIVTLAVTPPPQVSDPAVVHEVVRGVDPHDVRAISGTWESPAATRLTVGPGECALAASGAAAEACHVINVSESCDDDKTFYFLFGGSWMTAKLTGPGQLVLQTPGGPVAYTRTV